MNKNITIGVAVILVLVLGFLYITPNTKDKSVEKYHYSIAVSSLGDITCTYPQMLSVSYQGESITHILPEPEKNPIIITFSDMNTATPKAKFIDATQTISEVQIIKIIDTEEKIIFIEGGGDPYLTVHTIYKNEGVSTLSKQIYLFGTPIGTMAMGSCLES